MRDRHASWTFSDRLATGAFSNNLATRASNRGHDREREGEQSKRLTEEKERHVRGLSEKTREIQNIGTRPKSAEPGFQDRCFQPLSHPSLVKNNNLAYILQAEL